MQIGLIESAWFHTPLDGKPGLEKAKEIGYQTIDIFRDPLTMTDEERRAYARDIADVGLPAPSLICIALGIADFHPAVQRFHVERAKRHVDFAAEFGASNVLFVLGEYMWQQEVIPPPVQWDTAVANTREIGEHAAGRGIELALELEPFDLSLVNTVDTMARFLDDVGLPNVRANVDCSHLWLMRIDAAEIARLAGRIAHVHFSDCDGEKHGDLPPGRGNTPLLSYLEAIRDTGYAGPVSLELEFPPPGTEMVPWVEEAYRETRALMEQAGVFEG
ncbi:MAG: sugar phosphate isomerase/epimerase [Thermoleophilia bacterium]|nr:sugar phosphate isomerase/epimerase [Thermoleophilia bacterium]